MGDRAGPAKGRTGDEAGQDYHYSSQDAVTDQWILSSTADAKQNPSAIVTSREAYMQQGVLQPEGYETSEAGPKYDTAQNASPLERYLAEPPGFSFYRPGRRPRDHPFRGYMTSQTSWSARRRTSGANYIAAHDASSQRTDSSSDEDAPPSLPRSAEVYNENDSPSDTRSSRVPTAARTANVDATKSIQRGKIEPGKPSTSKMSPVGTSETDAGEEGSRLNERSSRTFGSCKEYPPLGQSSSSSSTNPRTKVHSPLRTEAVSRSIVANDSGLKSPGNITNQDLSGFAERVNESISFTPGVSASEGESLNKGNIDDNIEGFDVEASDMSDSNHIQDSLLSDSDTDDVDWLKSLNFGDRFHNDMTESTFENDSDQSSSPRMPLPPDLNLDEELLNPRAHEVKTKRIQAAVVANSAFHLLADRQENQDHNALPSLDQVIPRILLPSQGFSRKRSNYYEMWNPLESKNIEYGDSAYMATLWREYTGSNASIGKSTQFDLVPGNVDVHTLVQLHRDLFESRNLLIRIRSNIHKLYHSRLSQGFISLVVVTDSRPGVATLQSVDVDQVYKFTALVDSLLHALYWTLSRATIFPRVDQGIRGEVQMFMSNLGKIGDIFEAEVLAPSSTFGLQAIVDICRVIGQVLDLALLTYCDAHLLALDETFLSRRFERLEIHYPTLFEEPQAQSPAVVIRPRSLSCLNGFLRKRKVWVFHYGTMDHETSTSFDAKLYLSTSIKAFADLWGPVWKISPRNSIGNAVLRYSVVVGAIIPWTRVSESEPEALPEEAFCHWIPSDEDGSDPATASPIDTQSHPLLLIGGATELTISPNSKCCADPISLLGTLLRQDCLQRVGTVKPHRYKDTETAQVQVGHAGVQIGGSVQWKNNPGITWKEYFVSSWKNEPDRRNPRLLERWCGIEVSLCTFNSRRRRLLHILGSDTMRNHLSNVFFRWRDPDCEGAYYSALNSEDSHAFYNLYVVRPEWRFDLGTAVSLCFEVLLHTGLDNNDDLKAFHAPTPSGDQEWLAILRHKIHNWVGLLKDSEHCATMAIATETCLEVSKPDWPKFPSQHCRQVAKQGDQFSVLETKLICLEPSKEPNWGDTHLPDSRLSFGSSGFLKVLLRLKRDGLLVRWKSRTPLLGKAHDFVSACGQHSERMEDLSLKAKSCGLYVVSRNACKLSPVACRPSFTSESVQEVLLTPANNPNLNHAYQEHRARSVESYKECTNTTVRVPLATASIIDTGLENQNQINRDCGLCHNIDASEYKHKGREHTQSTAIRHDKSLLDEEIHNRPQQALRKHKGRETSRVEASTTSEPLLISDPTYKDPSSQQKHQRNERSDPRNVPQDPRYALQSLSKCKNIEEISLEVLSVQEPNEDPKSSGNGYRSGHNCYNGNRRVARRGSIPDL